MLAYVKSQCDNNFTHVTIYSSMLEVKVTTLYIYCNEGQMTVLLIE